jgi:RNA polymerase sigma-70 factor (ECF subfamily)
MPTENLFLDLMRRVRRGEADAAAELVRQYEPEIRRAVRVRRTNPQLGRVLDSMDICQSVLANFFVRAGAGQFELDRPEDLLKLLITMARNKLRDEARREQAGRRDHRRLEEGGLEEGKIPAAGASPSQVVAGHELWHEARRRLSREELYLADQRALGRDWADLAAELGDSAEALRKRLARALDRVARQLGLDEVAHA